MKEYKRLFEKEVEIPDKFEIPIINISFKPVFGETEDEVKHSNPAEFMSKIIYIIKHYISKHKNEIFTFSGATREDESIDKPTTRIKIYKKIISKFIKPENLISLPNKLIFFTESKKLQELDLITKVDKKTISTNKSKFGKIDFYKFMSLGFSNQLSKNSELYLVKILLSKTTNIKDTSDKNILTTIYYDDKHDKYLFIQIDENFNNDYKIFEVNFEERIIHSKTLETYDLEHSDFVKKLASKGKLEKI